MKVTLKDISEATGFSVSTVSRVIRGEGGTAEESVKEIITTALELGYPIHNRSKILPGIQTATFALITDFRTGEFYSSFVRGFVESGQEKDIRISLFHSEPDSEQLVSTLNHLRILGYHGAILFITDLNEDDYRQMQDSLPLDFSIISCSNIDHSIVDTVTFDSYQGASLVARHFDRQGFEKLGIIEGPKKLTEARFRFNGFTDYIKHVAEKEVVWSFTGDYTAESGAKAFEAYHESDNKPEAIFALNDEMAVGFIEAAKLKGVKIPQDVAIAGYDDLPLCKAHFPNLTSVHTDYTKLASKAIDQVLAHYNDPKPQDGIVSMIPVSLKVRDSSLLKRD
jgi:DNA-binding LacI/PurR family transcriptional regulator